MSERRALASGDVLAQRYELHDLVTEKLGSTTWRAHDQVLNRNVGIEMLSSADPRADHFIKAAKDSTAVTDPRFLRVLDLIENEKSHHLVIREWARAFPLDQLLLQSPLPNRRAATVVAEVAEALAHAHEHGVYHRRLTPHQVLLKQSGAVRVVGLGVATALAPVNRPDSFEDLQAYEQSDVQALGRLLYACLVSRWPGAHVDGLKPAPVEHGRLLRPRQVRAGVSRDVDTVCDRILGTPPRHHEPPLRRAGDIARTLRLSGEDDDLIDDQPSLARISSPDLLRLDPVIVPVGPPPGLEAPRRRPKAYEPAPPTSRELNRERLRGFTHGDRGLVLLGVMGVVILGLVLALLVSQTGGGSVDGVSPDSPIRVLPAQSASDFDPEGEDLSENPESVGLAIDSDPKTGWRTSTYLGSPELGNIKSGVGIILDVGEAREITSVRVTFAGEPTDFSVLVTESETNKPPKDLTDVREVVGLDSNGATANVTLQSGVVSRFIVIWLRRLPEVGANEFRGEIREVTIRGRS